MKRIGQFAKDNQITIRAVQHYEKLGLISPADVDDFTGYRYYDDIQSNNIRQILFLKSLGFSLSEVKDILDSNMNRDYFLRLLIAKKKQTDIDIEVYIAKKQMIDDVLSFVMKSQDDKIMIKEIMNMTENIDNKVIITENPYQKLIYKIYNKAMDKGRDICILVADMNRFKQINDNYGYDIGDIVLERAWNTIIKESMHINHKNLDEYSVLTRANGDEFHIFLQDGIDVARELAKNIIRAVSSIDFNDVAKNLDVSCTVGIAGKNKDDNRELSDLRGLAIVALHKAKKTKDCDYLIYED